MEQLKIFLKGLLSIIVGLLGGITCIGAITTGQPLLIVCGVVTFVVWVWQFIKYMKNNFKNGGM